MNFPKFKLFIWRIYQYFIFFYYSKSKWKIHSPFVYELTTKVFPYQPSKIGHKIELIRKEYLKNHQIIEIQDFGAGYNNQKKEIIFKTLSQVTRSSARKRKEGELLYRMILHHKPQNFLELGTNLGFSTAYIAFALKEVYQNNYHLTTIEGSKELQNYAKQLFKNLNLHANFIHQNFDGYLLTFNEKKFDGIFIDGNHTYEATIRYFEFFKNQIKEGGFIIFDDIYWNSSMKKAWNKIIQDTFVTLSLDLFHLGIVYIKKNQAKEHFRIWY